MAKFKKHNFSPMLALNLAEAHRFRKPYLSKAEFLMFACVIVLTALMFSQAFMPEMAFTAECQNIQGGDICSITLK